MSNLRLSNKRLKGVTKHVPIVIGSIALWQGKKADENHTHKYDKRVSLNDFIDGHAMYVDLIMMRTSPTL